MLRLPSNCNETCPSDYFKVGFGGSKLSLLICLSFVGSFSFGTKPGFLFFLKRKVKIRKIIIISIKIKPTRIAQKISQKSLNYLASMTPTRLLAKSKIV